MTLRLTVKVTPGAAEDAITGWAQDERGRPLLLVRVHAKPQENEANLAVAALLARALDRPKSAARLVSGARSRIKALEIEGASEADLSALKRRLESSLT